MSNNDNELKFLRYFYDRAGEAFGPADYEIYEMIKEDYVEKTGNELPEGYGEE